jgi:hypothetical protein
LILRANRLDFLVATARLGEHKEDPLSKHQRKSFKSHCRFAEIAAGFCALTFFFHPSTSYAQTWDWRTETVDTAGKFTSIATDRDGDIHLSYSNGETIKYAFRPAGEASKWFAMSIDGGNSYTNLALDSEGHPHICYTGGVLRYAHWDGADWKIQKIATDNAPIGFSCAVAVSPDGTPHISWYRERNGDDTPYAHIKYAELENGVWIVQTLDFDMQTGKWESMTLDPQGSPILSFDAYVKGLLKYAYKVGNDWKVSTVDFRGHTNNIYDVGMGNSLAVDKNGKPAISYEDGEDIKFARPEGDKWKVEIVDSFHPLGSWVGYRTSLAFDGQNRPHIVYDASGALKHAYWDGQKWRIEILARAGFTGYRYSSVTIDKHDSIYVSYNDSQDGSLKVAIGELKTTDEPAKSSTAQVP